MIDVDCEDPPELIPRFVAEHEQGYDIVYGERVDRPEPTYLKWLRKSYYRLVRAVADDNFVLNMAEFSLITAEVRNAVIDEINSFPFIRASIGRIGFRRKNVPYTRERRSAGETHYNLIGMTDLRHRRHHVGFNRGAPLAGLSLRARGSPCLRRSGAGQS